MHVLRTQRDRRFGQSADIDDDIRKACSALQRGEIHLGVLAYTYNYMYSSAPDQGTTPCVAQCRRRSPDPLNPVHHE